MQTVELTIAILAGGRSRRMGRDKASLPVQGETLLERTARIASATGLPTIVVGRSQPDGWPHRDIGFFPDNYPGLGPLGGLSTALRCAGQSVLLLPCDMPCLTAEALAWLIDAVSHFPVEHGLIVRNGDRMEPLFSCYAPASFPLVEDHLRRNLLAMRECIAVGRFTFVDLPAKHIPALRNVNRPEEMEEHE